MNLSASHSLPGAPARAAGIGAKAVRTAGVPRRVVAATVAGNALEFYDFVT